MKLTYLVAGLIPLFFLGCSAHLAKLPESFSMKFDENISKIITQDQFRKLVEHNKHQKIEEDSHTYDGASKLTTHKKYLYTFYTANNYQVKGNIVSTYCALDTATYDCAYTWAYAPWFNPGKSFNDSLTSAKTYYTTGIFKDITDFNAVKPKIEACQSKINPTVKIKDKTGILGSNVEKYFSLQSKWNKVKADDYIGLTYGTEFNCEELKDSLDVFVKATGLFSANEKNQDYVLVKNIISPVNYDINTLSYWFLRDTYTISDKYINVKMKYSNDSNSIVIPTISLENHTNEFLELQGISVYYGSQIREYLGVGDSHIDIAPESKSNILSNNLFNIKGLGPMYVPIRSLGDSLKIGLAIKYRIKSTNQIQTLYKTDILKIQTN